MATAQHHGKTEAQEIGWEITQSREPYTSERFAVREEEIRIPSSGERISFAYADRSTEVIIVPVTTKGEVILVRQYRFPVDEWLIETPAGSTNDTGDLPLEEVVRKELKEEIGGTAGRLQHVGGFYSAPAYSNERCEVFIAWDVELTNAPEREPTEVMEVELVSAAEALRLAETAQIQNAQCALGLCLCREALKHQISPTR